MRKFMVLLVTLIAVAILTGCFSTAHVEEIPPVEDDQSLTGIWYHGEFNNDLYISTYEAEIPDHETAIEIEVPEPTHIDLEFILEHHSGRIWIAGDWWWNEDIIVRSVEELHEYAERFIFSYWVNREASVEAYFWEIANRFDDAFFEERMLVLAYTETGTGTANVTVPRVILDNENRLQVHKANHIPNYEEGMELTDDIGNHFLIISISHIDDAFAAVDFEQYATCDV
ncbi:MAG: hypothetical protein FWC89_12920 [Defluviitaleaceae bacterium]|nr:hypothetical protein [Defluviitaleaceae bacterium]